MKIVKMQVQFLSRGWRYHSSNNAACLCVFCKLTSQPSVISSISCKRKYGHPCSVPPAATCCVLFCYSALSLSSSFSAAVALIALRSGVVRDEPSFPRTRQADATCGTASLSNYGASRLLEILSCFAEAANSMASLVSLVELAL